MVPPTGVPAEVHPADWALDGRRAGLVRNAVMVATRPDLCLAFIHNHSPGATHCATLAERAGIPTTRHHHTNPNQPHPRTAQLCSTRR